MPRIDVYGDRRRSDDAGDPTTTKIKLSLRWLAPRLTCFTLSCPWLRRCPPDHWGNVAGSQIIPYALAISQPRTTARRLVGILPVATREPSISDSLEPHNSPARVSSEPMR